jgi:hypothetical protein
MASGPPIIDRYDEEDVNAAWSDPIHWHHAAGENR